MVEKLNRIQEAIDTVKLARNGLKPEDGSAIMILDDCISDLQYDFELVVDAYEHSAEFNELYPMKYDAGRCEL